jgi:glycosyltransferase involved in cell wall biosynthesis
MPMRIALLSWESMYSIAVGGLAPHVSELAAALQIRGHEVHVFTRIGPNQLRYENIGGVHYHRCPYQTHGDFLTDNEQMCNSFIWHLAEMEAFVGVSFDIVHGHDWLTVRAMTQAKNRHHRPVVMTVHATEFGRCGNRLFDGASKRIRDIEWEGTYAADRVICVSGVLRKEVHELYAVPMDKMDVVYNGVDVGRFDNRVDSQAVRRRYDVGVDDPAVLFAGRMTSQKGPDLLLDAVPGLRRHHASARFIFAGDGDMREDLEHRAQMMGVAPAICFLGHQTGRDLLGLFKAADMVCVPSRNEPFGIVILEAWSARKPVVATRNGGPAEFIRHEDTGVTVAADHESIGQGVDAVLSDRTYGRRLGRNGRREAESHFTWDVIAGQTEEVYQSVLQRYIR